jgi:large-conductance mechanosensitive channel/ribosomal protein L37E
MRKNDNEVNVMVCNSCGRDIQNENANFCEYCGDSLKSTNNYTNQNVPGDAPTSIPGPMQPQAALINHKEQPVSFSNWLGTYMIRFIPFVGSLVFFVMLIVWSIGRDVSESKKNWARAKLVYKLITFIIVAFFVFLIILVLNNDPEFMNMWNTEMQQYNDLLNDYR